MKISEINNDVELDFDNDFNEIANNFSNDFNFDFEETLFDFGEDSHRLIKTKKRKLNTAKYQYAVELAKDIKLQKDENIYAIIDGKFIFGDFIEALFVEKNIYCENLIISTLSLSVNNIDSLNNLLNGGYVGHIDLIVSDYFYSHEKYNMIKYLFETIDNTKIQLSVCSNHTKIVLMQINDNYITIHGSSNLRSSDCIEQIQISNCEQLYNFNLEFMSNIINEYQINKKSLRSKKLWQVVHPHTQE